VEPVTAQIEKRGLLDTDNEIEKWPIANPDEFLNIVNDNFVLPLGLLLSKALKISQ
jgi:hypothetical protein